MKVDLQTRFSSSQGGTSMPSPAEAGDLRQWLAAEYAKDVKASRAGKMADKALAKFYFLRGLLDGPAGVSTDGKVLNVAAGANLMALVDPSREVVGIDADAQLVDWASEAGQIWGLRGNNQITNVLSGELQDVVAKERPSAVLCSHACGGLTDAALDAAVHNRVPAVVVLTCCSFRATDVSHHVIGSGWYTADDYDALAKASGDVHRPRGFAAQAEINRLRADFLRRHGYVTKRGWRSQNGKAAPSGGWVVATLEE